MIGETGTIDAEMRAACKSLRIAYPWQRTGGEHRYWPNGWVREVATPFGPMDAAKCGESRNGPGNPDGEGPVYWGANVGDDIYSPDEWGWADTIEAAKAKCDAALLADGWTLRNATDYTGGNER